MDAAEEILENLIAYHGQKFSKEQMNDYAWFFDGQENAAEVLSEWKRQNAPSARFPSIHQLVQLADTIRLTQWQKQKESEPTFKEFAESTSSRSEHGRVALSQMQVHGPKAILWMRSMETKFPGKGWLEEAADLEKFFNEEPERHKQGAWVMERMRGMREGGVDVL